MASKTKNRRGRTTQNRGRTVGVNVGGQTKIVKKGSNAYNRYVGEGGREVDRDATSSARESIRNLSTSRNRARNDPQALAAINSEALNPTKAIELPSYPEDKNYNGLIQGNNAGLASLGGLMMGENGQLSVPPLPTETGQPGQPGQPGQSSPAPTGDSGAMGRWQNFVNTLGIMPQKANVYEDRDYQRQQKQVDKSRKELNNYTSNLNSIVTKSQAESLALEGQGRGVTESIIGGQQAQINREAAIAALPVQAQIAAAQGNLDMAERQLSEVYQIKSEALNNEYQYKVNQYNSIKEFLTKEEDRKLAQMDLEESRKYNEGQNNIKSQDDWARTALASGRPDLITAIHGLDPKSPTFRTDLARIQSKLGQGSGGDRTLSLEEASKFGVPYGTKLSALIGTVPGGGNTNPEVAKENAQDFQFAKLAHDNVINTIKEATGKTDLSLLTLEDMKKLNDAQAEVVSKALSITTNPKATRATGGDDALGPTGWWQKFVSNPIRQATSGKKYSPQNLLNAVKTIDTNYKGIKTNYSGASGGTNDQYSTYRSQVPPGQILISRNGQVGYIPLGEFNPSTDQEL